MKETKSHRLFCVSALVVVILVVIAVVVAVTVVYATRSDDTQSRSEVSYKVHVNPADPVILSAETEDGDIIFMLGNKCENGEPQTIDEFLIEDEDGSSFVLMNNDGTIESAQGNDGLQIDFNWDENQTTVYTSVVLKKPDHGLYFSCAKQWFTAAFNQS